MSKYSYFLILLLAATLSWAQQSSQFVPLSPSEASFARQVGLNPDSVTQEQADKARSMLGGRDPSSLTPMEIDMAKQNIAKYNKNKPAHPAAVASDSLKKPSQAKKIANEQVPDSTEQPPELPPVKPSLRYEVNLFANALPSAFYDQQSAVSADYPIKPDDALVLTLWGAVEKEYHLAVNNQGKVNVEGIGLVSLNALTLGKAEAVLRAKLKGIYAGISSGKIQVNLRPESLSATKVFVLGDVLRAGGYDLPGNSNVFLALYRAKGPTELGSVRRIQITHANGEKNELDLYEYLFKGIKPESAILQDGDVVFLPRAEKLVAVQGDVGRPAVFELKGTEGLTEALAFAGNLNPTAAHTLSLWRIMDDGRKDVQELGAIREIVAANKAVPLLDGDSLFIPSSSKLAQDYIDVTGAVWYPGQYKWQAGMTVLQAVALAGGARTEALLERVLVKRILADSSEAVLSDALNGSGGIALLARDQVVVLNQSVLKAPTQVSISGAVKKAVKVDWQEGMKVKTLLVLADGFLQNHQRGEIRVERLVPGKDQVTVLKLKIQDDMSLETGADMDLLPGDRVVVPSDPDYYMQELVSIDGAVRNPGKYSLVRSREGFKDFMDRVVSLDQNAFPEGGRLLRKRGLEMYQINFSMKEALEGKDGNRITLQGGDSIFVPAEQLTVQILGEVVSPGDVLWDKDKGIADYIDASGGYTITGDKDRVVVAYANGSKATMKRAERDPDPGSVITVPFKKEDETDWFKVWTTVATILAAVAQVALAIAVINKQ